MFYEAMEELLPDLKVIIDNSDTGIEKIMPLEPIIEVGEAAAVQNN